ncbi:MAG: ethylammeline chlorohydrolase, partial [Nitrospinae bacterium]|nr:ethylammeline chlorohydrolase [Nitrospinota bacterium]
KTGAVAPGMPADLIALRTTGPAPATWTDLPFAPDRREADFVMLDGETVFRK